MTKTKAINKAIERDKENINYLFQTVPTKLLAQILEENTDLKYYVKRELANRGQDREGKWIGFDKAKKLHRIIT